MNTHWLRQSSRLPLLLLSVSLSLQSCSHKPAPLEEEGDPPMTVMEMKAPEQDKTEKWKLAVTPQSTVDIGKPVALTLKVEQVGDGSHDVSPGASIKFAQSHILVICKDGNEFQNLKPAESGPNEFATEVVFPHPGQYVVALQFVTSPHKNHTVIAPFQVGKGTTGIATRKSDADQLKTVDGYEFTLSSYPVKTGEVAMPTFRITKDKRPVSNIEVLNPGLPNDAGFAVLISDDSNNFVQTAPVTLMAANKLFEQPVMFHTIVEKPGNYKIWAQFKINGKVTTVNFSFKVEPK
ncbi:MAG: hypothetical protein P4L53_21640 [Candidatus Obscuribacterales bacterium]|nr:hypothetical protein [Candidatus Obscuribacterales bacterium]